MTRKPRNEIRKARLHLKVATSIFFESNGGQAKKEATIPELRLDLGAPDIDVMNSETALEALLNRVGYVTFFTQMGRNSGSIPFQIL